MPTDKTMSRFRLKARGPFDLGAVRELQCGFLRGSRSCSTDDSTVRLAFPLDRTFEVVGVTLRHHGDTVEGDVVRTHEGEAVARQVARALGLDHDATPFAELLAKDPALRPISEGRPGFRPVVSYSPYVMAGWAVLSQRLRMAQAAAIQVRIAEATGDTVNIDEEVVASFPRPQSMLALEAFPGVSEEKWRRLHTIARAALEGELEVERLVALGYEEARERLMGLRGIGPWTADGILMRGCGLADLLPLSEPTLHAAVGLAYGLATAPEDKEVAAIAETWRPFRMWVSVLLISHYYRAMEGRTQPFKRGAARGKRPPRS